MTKKISFKSKKNREEAADAWIQSRGIPVQTPGSTQTLGSTQALESMQEIGSMQEAIIMKRFTIDLPADLHRQFKSYCADKGFMMADVVRSMLEDKLRDS